MTTATWNGEDDRNKRRHGGGRGQPLLPARCGRSGGARRRRPRPRSARGRGRRRIIRSWSTGRRTATPPGTTPIPSRLQPRSRTASPSGRAWRSADPGDHGRSWRSSLRPVSCRQRPRKASLHQIATPCPSPRAGSFGGARRRRFSRRAIAARKRRRARRSAGACTQRRYLCKLHDSDRPSCGAGARDCRRQACGGGRAGL